MSAEATSALPAPADPESEDSGNMAAQAAAEETDELDALPDPADTEGSEPNESHSTESPEDFHARLKKLINSHEKELRKPRKALSDTQAVNRLFDLVALKRYNELRLSHALKLRQFHKKIGCTTSRAR
jgi:hypothetical protein